VSGEYNRESERSIPVRIGDQDLRWETIGPVLYLKHRTSRHGHRPPLGGIEQQALAGESGGRSAIW
jgi:hypothetical protein